LQGNEVGKWGETAEVTTDAAATVFRRSNNLRIQKESKALHEQGERINEASSSSTCCFQNRFPWHVYQKTSYLKVSR
jgi:hypothetical protein